MATKVLVQLFNALSDETRLKIVLMLSKHDTGTSCQMLRTEFHLSQPAMAHHFKVLRESKLVRMRKEGRRVYYTLNRELLDMYLRRFMQEVTVGELPTRPLHTDPRKEDDENE